MKCLIELFLKRWRLVIRVKLNTNEYLNYVLSNKHKIYLKGKVWYTIENITTTKRTHVPKVRFPLLFSQTFPFTFYSIFCRCRQFHGRHHLRDNIEAIIVNLKWFLMRCHNCHLSRTDIYCEFKEICIFLDHLSSITHTLIHSTFCSGARQPIQIAF